MGNNTCKLTVGSITTHTPFFHFQEGIRILLPQIQPKDEKLTNNTLPFLVYHREPKYNFRYRSMAQILSSNGRIATTIST